MLAGVWQNLKIERLGPGALAPARGDWAGLSATAQEAAGFASAAFARPILEQAGGSWLESVRQEGRMVMAVPAMAAAGHDVSLTSDLTASGLPQVDHALPREAVLAFLNGRQRPFLFQAIPAESQFLAQLKALSPQYQVMRRWQRAALPIQGDFESWMAENFDHKRRKELKRLRNRLAEQGDLKFETLNHSNSLDGFVQALLELEAKGWKGARGTALKADDAKAKMFRQICENLQAIGALRFWQVSFNGRAIASLFGMVQGDTAWIVKIAYDESFAKFSPGVMLIIEATQALFAEPGLKLADSCAIPEHPMINRIWRGRVEMVDVLVAPAHVSALKFNLVKAALASKSALRARAKSIFYALTKRKKS